MMMSDKFLISCISHHYRALLVVVGGKSPMVMWKKQKSPVMMCFPHLMVGENKKAL